ncbi:MAG: Gx transporter family protein [Calditerrivibrio sp.]|nr:Gx transporter family protein [Calditerrivibrio sp.]
MMVLQDKEKTVAALASFSIILGLLENFVPMPIPFVRIGLSNIPVVMGVYLLDLKYLFILGAIKSIVTAIFSTGFIFRLIIAFPSLMVAIVSMYFYHKLTNRYSSLVSVSVVGSVTNITMQFIIIKLFVVKDLAFLKILPYFIILAVVTGFLIGYLSNSVLNKRGSYVSKDYTG